MSLFDYLMVYPTRAAALVDLADVSYEGRPAVVDGGFNPAFATEPRVYVLTGRTVPQGDGQGGTVDVPERQYLPHAYVWLTLPARDPAVEARAAFGLAADRAAFDAGRPDFLLATSFTPDQLGACIVEPVVAGTRYPFG